MSSTTTQPTDSRAGSGVASQMDKDCASKLLARRAKLKALLVSLALSSVLLGMVFSVLVSLDFDFFLDIIDFRSAPDEASLLSRTKAAAVLNLLLFVLSLLGGLAGLRWMLRAHGECPQLGPYGDFCVRWTRQPLSAAFLHLFTGLLLLPVLWGLLVRYAEFVTFVSAFPLTTSFALGLVAWSAAIFVPFPTHIADAAPPSFPALRMNEAPSVAKASLSGADLIEALKQTALGKTQFSFEKELLGTPFASSAQDSFERLRRRFPRLEAILHCTEIAQFSADQSKALDSILDSDADSTPTDHVLVGWPGSGRTSLVNLLSLGVVLHHEGAMYCVSAEGPKRNASGAGSTRHPAPQMRRWLASAQLDEAVCVVEAYAESTSSSLALERHPDILFTDVRTLSRTVLAALKKDARALLHRLRYIIIDHPNRLSREDWLHLSIALARLRMSAELLGRRLTFIIILPRLNNFQALAKSLVNNDNVCFHSFAAWTGPSHLAGWLPRPEESPAAEALDDAVDDSRPGGIERRKNFTREVISLLAELGRESNREAGNLRIAVVDTAPLMGPEARDFLRTQVQSELSRQFGQRESFVICQNWVFFGSPELGFEKGGEFDVVVGLGVGSHPSHLVSTLRPAVAADGVLLLVGTSSPEDVESFQEMQHPDWQPGNALLDLNYPSLLIPEHSSAIIEHELALLFEEFPDEALPEHRVRAIFPGESCGELLEKWLQQRFISRNWSFRSRVRGERPERMAVLRRREAAFSSEPFEVPWGCCSREVYHIFDEAARRYSAVGPHLTEHVDADRFFIDFHPRAVLRFPPNSVVVNGLELRSSSDGGTAFVERGELHVAQLPYNVNVGIDRRAARYSVDVFTEWLGQSPTEQSKDVASVPERVDQVGPLPIVLLTPRESDVGFGATAMFSALQPLTIRHTGSVPALRASAGSWNVKLREKIRDVVQTDEHLSEGARYVSVVAPRFARGMERCVETHAMSFFFEWMQADQCRDGEADSFAAHHALARSLRLALMKQYVNFSTEYRIAIVTHPQPHPSFTPYRILLYRLRNNEFSESGELRHSLLDAFQFEKLLRWIAKRLDNCDCLDGCFRCCGGLGTASLAELPRDGFDTADAISRQGARRLLDALLGRTAVDGVEGWLTRVQEQR